jgi:SprA-related family
MLRPIDSTTSFADSPLRSATLSVRPAAGAGERSSAGNLEQAAVAVRQAAVVALGAGARAVSEHDAESGATSHPQPPASQGSRSGIDPAIVSAVAARYKIVRGADGVDYAVSDQVLVNASSIKENPEAAIRELTQIREAALTPPTSPSDLQLAARAALDVQRAQLEMARARYAREANTDTAPSAQAPHVSTDVKA